MNTPTKWRTAAASTPVAHTNRPLIKLVPNPARGLFYLAALATIYYAIFGGVFAVTGELTRWGAGILGLFGFDINSLAYYAKLKAASSLLERTDGVMLLSLCLGSWAYAALSCRASIRNVANMQRASMALIGGFLAGFGARLASGCNLANFFTGIPYFSLHPWVFAIFMILGIFAALRVLPTSSAIAERCDAPYKSASKRPSSRLLAVIPVAIIAALFLYLGFGAKPILAIACAFGVAFGAVIFSQQICFTSLFRDLIIFAKGRNALACFAAMALAGVAVWALQLHGAGAKVLPLSAALAVGAFIFGFGITLAGGCECGFIFRAASGQLHFWLVGVGNLLGTMALAFFYEHTKGSWLYAGEKFKLADFSGLLIFLALCALSCALIFLASRRKISHAKAAIPASGGEILRVMALGEPCPYPALIYHSHKFAVLERSDIKTLEIICDCEQALASVPAAAAADGLRCECEQTPAQIIFRIHR